MLSSARILMWAAALGAVLCAAPPAYAEPRGAGAPARVTVYPVSRRREGEWMLQRIALQGEFLSSLGATLTEALPDSLLDDRQRRVMAWDIAGLLRWDVDFARGLDDGDSFSIVFERFIGDHGEIRYGRLLAAEMRVGRRSVSVYGFDAPDGRIVYYDAEGRSLERSYLSAPVDFQKITSGFSRARFHPVLHRWRAHQGIDYAAETGAPVRSIADGVVLRAGWIGGYGRLVEIRHGNGIITRYGHLSRFTEGIRAGMSVTQGDVVGAVGSSGLATGPHLHFELRLNGVATDPRFLPRESGTPIAEEERIAFVLQRQKLRQYLAVDEQPTVRQAAFGR
jgi:murein DD-endopeptidase MepM/ murein hydrolase activator NlpD